MLACYIVPLHRAPNDAEYLEMEMKRVVLLLVSFSLFLGAQAHAALQSSHVSYEAEGVTLKGYLVYDDEFTGKRPGILVVHEWWGNGKYTRYRADMLARLGYVALAVDMYGDGKVVDHPDEASKFASQISQNFVLARARFVAAMNLLKAQAQTDPGKIAAIGYCMGGGVVLNMARAGLDLAGVVSFHGSLKPSVRAEPGTIRAKILVLNGAEDPFVTPAAIRRFEAEMLKAGARFRIVSYPGAWHSFTNPEANIYGEKFDLPLAYDREADLASWREMQLFFKNIFN